MCRALPFGEGIPVSGDDRIERRSKARGRERERERERKSWLMRIAKGEYEWPSPLPLPFPQGRTGIANAQSEPCGTRLAHLTRVRNFVERLLVRDPKKRATLRDIRDDEWLAGSSKCHTADYVEGQLVNRNTIGPVARQEIG
jgi:serine/threonine protein kinase